MTATTEQRDRRADLDAELAIASASKYGYGKLPFGKCHMPACEKAACHRYETMFVCREHLPEDVVFAPFLGQQEKFFACTARWVLFGGGAGGTKTYGAARKWIPQFAKAQEFWELTGIQSKGHAIFFRRTMPELLQVIDGFKRYYQKIDAGAQWNEKYHLCTFPCGYKVQFAGIEGDSDWLKYYGPEYTLVVFDEAVQFTQTQIEELDTRIRTDDPVLKDMLQLVLCTNPIGSITKLYLRKRFVEAADPEQEVKVRVRLADGRILEEWQVYIPATVYDNPALAEDGRYEGNILTKGSAKIRALLLNDWYVDEGAWVGDDWDPSVHICKPFKIPSGWFKFKMADYGHSWPSRTSVMWAACDPEGNMVVYRSYSCRYKTAQDLGQVVREIEIQAGEWDREADVSNVYGPMDSSLWARVGETGPSRGEILDNIGCSFTRSDKNPDSAAEAIRSRLRRRTPDAQGQMTVPGLRFFDTCWSRIPGKDGKMEKTGPILTIPLVEIDPNNPDRWDTNGDDHDMDALGYGCLSRPIEGESDVPQDPGQAVVIEILRFRDQPKTAAIFPER